MMQRSASCTSLTMSVVMAVGCAIRSARVTRNPYFSRAGSTRRSKKSLAFVLTSEPSAPIGETTKHVLGLSLIVLSLFFGSRLRREAKESLRQHVRSCQADLQELKEEWSLAWWN